MENENIVEQEVPFWAQESIPEETAAQLPELENSPDEQIIFHNPQEVPAAAPGGLKGLMCKWWFWVIVAVLAVIVIGAVSGEEDSSSSGGGSYSAPAVFVNPYVRLVKETENSNYGITYGAAFERFFTNTSWEYFSATTGEDVVEFEGGFLYDNKPATATIQFVIDTDEGMLEVYHLSINGVDQSRLMLITMLQKVFESY